LICIWGFLAAKQWRAVKESKIFHTSRTATGEEDARTSFVQVDDPARMLRI